MRNGKIIILCWRNCSAKLNNGPINILIIEPYFTGSHAAWANGYQKFSRHNVEILSLKGQYWKWRMHGGAVTLAREFLEMNYLPDVIFATDMLDLTTFLALTRSRTSGIPVALYFHENQICYPWSPTDRDVAEKRDRHYGFINYASALAANRVFFNSQFHKNAFFDELPKFLKHFPDYNEFASIEALKNKSDVLHLGLELSKFDQFKNIKQNKIPIILWNHRWEYDKNPKDFFKALYKLVKSGREFEVVLLGENFSTVPIEFETAKQKLGNRIVHYGYAESFADYAQWLWKADILPVTSHHDFFGASVVEAVYCECVPLLPNRLSYPDLFPIEKHSNYFYKDEADLLQKLKDIEDCKNRGPLQKSVDKFCWGNMAPIYDATMKALIL
jgi:glycosyltransferase involved in cell wall biosynthesis